MSAFAPRRASCAPSTFSSPRGHGIKGLIHDLGVELPLEVSRHVVLTFRGSEPYGPTLPIVKDLSAVNKMYLRPASGGVVLVGTGDHGDPGVVGGRDGRERAESLVLLQVASSASVWRASTTRN